MSTLEDLDQKAVVQILTELKNALTKQYKKLLNMDNVTIDFDTKALELIATIAQKRKVGAKALRCILEDLMLDIMINAQTTKTKLIKIITKEVNTYIKEPLSKDLQEQLKKE